MKPELGLMPAEFFYGFMDLMALKEPMIAVRTPDDLILNGAFVWV